MTAHRPHKVRLFPKIPQTYGRDIKNIKDINIDMLYQYITNIGLNLI